MAKQIAKIILSIRDRPIYILTGVETFLENHMNCQSSAVVLEDGPTGLRLIYSIVVVGTVFLKGL